MQKPKIICVTGGKGGTGKTLVAVNLAIMLKNHGYKVLL
ncbi:MAG: nucleotide-binding protein, partial [Promethearchaeota archaeon]